MGVRLQHHNRSCLAFLRAHFSPRRHGDTENRGDASPRLRASVVNEGISPAFSAPLISKRSSIFLALVLLCLRVEGLAAEPDLDAPYLAAVAQLKKPAT